MMVDYFKMIYRDALEKENLQSLEGNKIVTKVRENKFVFHICFKNIFYLRIIPNIDPLKYIFPKIYF